MAERQQEQARPGFSAPILDGSAPVPFMGVARTSDDVRGILAAGGITDPGTLRVMDCASQLRGVSEHFGGRIASSLASAPPIVVEVSQETMDRVTAASGIHVVAGAFYLRGTNIILTTATLDASPTARDDVLTHEISHYAAFLGRGGNTFTFEASPGTGYTVPTPSWMEEGMAEFYTSRILGSRSMGIEYACDTVTWVLVEHLVGRDVLRDAFTGSGGGYTALRQALDARLGEGAFMTLVGLSPMADGRPITTGAEALDFLANRAGERGVDISALTSDPIYRMAFPSTPGLR